MNIVPRQQHGGGGAAAAGGANGTKAKDPMMQPAGPGLPPLFVWVRKLHSRVGMNILWWILTGIVGVLAIFQVIRLLRARSIRNRVAKARQAGAAPTATAPGFLAKLSAVRAGWTNFAHVRVPLYFFPNHSLNEWFWTAAYVGLVLGLTFWGSIYKGEMNYTRVFGLAVSGPLPALADAPQSFAQLPFIVGLAGRNNVISLLTGISYERLNWLHRVAGRTCVLTAWVHMGAMVGQVGIDPTAYTPATGILGLTAVSLMFLSSFGVFRRLAYEAFIIMHICLGITLLVALYFHRPMYRQWVWASMVIWGFDRFVSLLKLAWTNVSRLGKTKSAARVTLLGPDAVRVTAVVPKLRWRPGQHAFLVMPNVAALRYEQHPFTMANAPSESGEATFLIRAHGGFTRRLVRHLQTSGNDVKCYVDGPYGIPPALEHCGAALLVCGGTGISFGLSLLLGLVKAAREGKSAVSSARLVWNTRDEDPAAWVAPLLADAIGAGVPLNVKVDIHRTRSRQGGDAEEANTLTGVPSEQSSYAGEHVLNEKRSDYGAKPTSHPAITLHAGRADVESILRRDIATCPIDAGGMAVVVCGPSALSLDTRRAVCNVNSPAAVAKGQPPIEFHAEHFGW